MNPCGPDRCLMLRDRLDGPPPLGLLRLVLEVPPLRWVAYMSTRMVRAWFRLRILIFNTSAAQPDYSTTPKLHVLSRTVETTLRFVAEAGRMNPRVVMASLRLVP